MSSHRQHCIEMIEAFVADTISADEQHRLGELLSNDAEARQLFLDYMEFNATLHWSLRSREQVVTIPEKSKPGTACPPQQSNDKSVAAAFNPSSSLTALSKKHYWSFRSRGNRLSPLLAAVVLIVAVLVVFQQRPANDVQQAIPIAEILREYPSFKSVQLQSGSVKLGIDKVGWVQVDGPTDFDLIGPMRARLNYGRIQMRVTEKTGRGFIVETPDGDVTDLGTEFGLEVSRGGRTGLVVFEGAVDLRVANTEPSAARSAERLVGGEGVVFNKDGEPARINSIVTGIASTFLCRDENLTGATAPTIVEVTDSLQTSDTKKYYEIVAGGLGEDAKAYVDRPEHEWNGVTKQGMPTYLIGADYVKPFNSDKVHSSLEISVELGRPAMLYVFFDDRVKKIPDWLAENFRKTGDKIGLDGGNWPGSKIHSRRGKGAGVSVDERFSIWQRTVTEPGIVTLGPNSRNSKSTSVGMYGIAAVPLEPSAVPISFSGNPISP